MPHLTGVYLLLANPYLTWVVAGFLYFATDVAVHIGRDRLEGLGYQVSYSAKIGDGALFISVLMIATMFYDGRVMHIPDWLQLGWVHAGIFVACSALGITVCLTTLGSRSGQVMDIYNDTIIAPALLYLAIALLPIVWYNAKWWEWIVVLVVATMYVWTIHYDITHDRMNQRQWLVSHGFAIKGGIPKQ